MLELLIIINLSKLVLEGNRLLLDITISCGRRTVGNGIGFWKCMSEEIPVYNSNGNIFAFKIYLTYFQGNSFPRKTDWTMEEYRLPLRDSKVGTASSQSTANF